MPPDYRQAERDYHFTRADFKRISAIAYREAGITMSDVKEALVYSRLNKRLRHLRMKKFSDYCDYVETEEGADELMKMISALTTNVTHFFREQHHFTHLSETVLPPLVERAQSGARVRLWSAGCSSGEEAYSIAFSLLRACPDAARRNIKILATDIDPQVLVTARRGLYPEEALSTVPSWAAEKYFEPSAGDGFRAISPAVQELIAFRRLNLVRPWPFNGPFDVIFCRNVTIYFDAETQTKLWQNFANTLSPGGHLYIGHSERLADAVRGKFETVGTTVFRLAEGTGTRLSRK